MNIQSIDSVIKEASRYSDLTNFNILLISNSLFKDCLNQGYIVKDDSKYVLASHRNIESVIMKTDNPQLISLSCIDNYGGDAKDELLNLINETRNQ